MTPRQILDEVKDRFMVVYVDEAVLERFLRQAMSKFQEKAGVIHEIWSDEPVFSLPEHFFSVAGCCDKARRYIPWRMGKDDNGKPVIELQVLSNRHESPYALSYFLNLRHIGLNEQIPADIDSILPDYLEALIAALNTKLEREAYLMANMTEAAQALPQDSELRQRITELEQIMEDNKAIIPPASMF